MKKYLFVIPSLSKGGAERVVSVLSSELIEHKRDVTIITHFKVENEYSISSNVKVVCLSNLYEDDYRRKISTMYLIKLAYKLRKVIVAENPDYILPFLWTTCIRVDLALMFSKYKKIVIQTIRNNPSIFPESKLMQLYRNYLVEKSVKTIVQNGEQKKYFRKIQHNKIFVLPNPVFPDLFNINRLKSNNQINIISVGRLEKQKNFDMLIDAFELINSKYKETRLHIYGEGSLMDHLQKKINRKDLKDIAILHGRSINYEEIYGSADIYVLSSDFEGMPNTLLEAMSVGIPCVSTNCPTGPSDIITDRKNGFLVPVNDINELANKILYLIENPKIAADVGNKARKSILENFVPDKVVTDLIKICERN